MRCLHLLLLFRALLAAKEAQALELTPSLLGQGEARAVAATSANPGNRIARLPARVLGVEARLEAKESLSLFAFTLRPRAFVVNERIAGANRHSGALFFQEAFVRADVTDWLSVSAGRVQFGWGPAESISPTNWFAPEVQWQASPYYEQLGVYRGQWNFSLGQGFSFVAAHELPPLKDHWQNQDQPDEAFRRRWFGKAEWSWDNGNKILGLVSGQERLASGVGWRAGSYGSWNLNDAWQVYADTVWRQLARGANDFRLLGVAGLRYTFEGGAEIRAEAIRNSAGQSPSELAVQRAQLATLSDASLLTIYQQRSANLLTRDYGYLAFRWANPAFLEERLPHSVIALRSLCSFSGSSASLLPSFETGLGENFSLAVYGSLGLGRRDHELRQLYDHLLGLALKAVF